MYIVEKVNLTNPFEVDEIKVFLNKFDLNFEEGIDYSVVVRVDGLVKGTCSKSKNILKCFAIDESLQGEGITNLMIKRLQDKLFDEGVFHSFIFTKPSYAKTFGTLGYREIERSDSVVLLESGFESIEKILDKTAKNYNLTDKTPKTALVMNCNPFTLGHRYLIEEASKRSEEVVVFIVEEDRSTFSFKDRFFLVEEGTRDLKNVRVVTGGPYIISSATFPAYFLKEKSVHLAEYTKLDGKIFGRYFGRKFNITKRMLGDEPYCEVTRSYNEALKEVLKDYNIEVEVIERKADEEEAISASRVRRILKEEEMFPETELRKLLPETTIEFLKTSDGQKVIEKIKQGSGRH